MKPKGRPKKRRLVRLEPKIVQFSPRGRPGRPEEIDLAMDEFEAIRLADWSSASQKSAARQMKISQQTFSRVLKKARRAMADAIVNGKILRIQGGCYAVRNTQEVPAKEDAEEPKPKQEQKEFSFI